MPTPPPVELFAAAAPGLELLVRDELRALGIAAEAVEGGAAWHGPVADAGRANLWLRTAGRVLARLAEFEATSFRDLEKLARMVPWETIVAPGAPVRFRVTCRKSRLYHSDAVAQRLFEAVAFRLKARPAEPPEGGDDDELEGEGAQLFVARFVHDRLTISADASGALLHRRGWRLATAKAPLRETLAAALVRASGWDRRSPLADPFCGSGTVAIEAALLARNVAPGLSRGFAVERWPGFDARAWDAMRDEARAAALPRSPAPIEAADRDAGAVDATRANAARAGVLDDLSVEQRPLSTLPALEGPGWVVTNPPYGVRVGEREPLRALYGALGRVMTERRPGATLAMLSADPWLDGQTGLRLRDVLRTTNGGIGVRVVVGRS